jgi:hypothetical protein
MCEWRLGPHHEARSQLLDQQAKVTVRATDPHGAGSKKSGRDSTVVIPGGAPQIHTAWAAKGRGLDQLSPPHVVLAALLLSFALFVCVSFMVWFVCFVLFCILL